MIDTFGPLSSQEEQAQIATVRMKDSSCTKSSYYCNDISSQGSRHSILRQKESRRETRRGFGFVFEKENEEHKERRGVQP
jgi:hypothetical protein